jgi:hypothetical protein
MEKLSKTIQLGVIILALRLLVHLKFPIPRLVRAAAHRLGVSRKSGYQAARRILEILQAPPGNQPDDIQRRELFRLRIKNQVLTYEREHPEVRFDDRHRHLPEEAKSLCVRIFRDFQDKLPKFEIAQVIGVPLSSLLRWDKEATDSCQFPQKPERRGIHRHARPNDVGRVLDEFKNLQQDMTLEEFTTSFNQKYPDRTLDRKTITRILQVNGLRKVETRGGTPPYHSPFQVYFPGAQVAIDGHQCDVVFKSEPEKAFTFNKEVGIDIASCAILGDALGKTETADGVNRVLIKIREEYKTVLALLCDNRSSNRAADVKLIFGGKGKDAQIFSFPYHPKTNGHMEGVFGQFVQIVGKIEIDDTSKETIASSIVEVVWRVFIHFHNYSPRERIGNQKPLEYFRSYIPLPEEVERARKELRKQQEKSRASREEHPRATNPGFRSKVEGLLKLHCLEVPIDNAVRALLHFDLRVIESASNAFFVYSQRDGFDERKRTFPYFMGIVRKKQKEVDNARLQRRIDLQKTDNTRAELRAAEETCREEKAQEANDLRRNPEKVILKYAELLLTGGLVIMRRTFGEGLLKGLQALHDLGRATQGNLEILAGTVRSWGKFKEDLKEEMVKLLFDESERVRAGAT